MKDENAFCWYNLQAKGPIQKERERGFTRRNIKKIKKTEKRKRANVRNLI